MAFFKQLCLLLKHKILLRRRQPATLVLELFWPAFVFLAILMVRWQFPSTFRQTCYYSAKALPSAGMVNLLQTYLCNLDNACLTRNAYEEVPSYPNASINSILDHFLPLLTDKNVTQVINDVPKGIRLVASIIDTLSIPSVQKLLDDGFALRKMIRPSGWKKVEEELNHLESNLVPLDLNQLVILSNQTSLNEDLSYPILRSYEILVNSSLNLMQFGIHSDSSSFESFRSFRDVICDHNQLKKFLIVPHPYQSRVLSRNLCLLERKDLYYLFDLVQENIDFTQILEQLSLIFRSVGLNDHQKNVDNIIAMMAAIDRANLFSSFNVLRNTSWMYDVPSLFDVLRSGEINFGTLLKIASDIEPMFGSTESGNDSINDLEQLQLQHKRQQQKIHYFMELYNSDDSILKADMTDDIEESNINDDNQKENIPPSTDFGDGKDDDLEMSESSQVDLISIATTNYPNDSLYRKFLPKFFANLDKFIDGVVKFTKTSQWDSLLNAVQGLQMMLEIFDNTNDSGNNKNSKAKISSAKIENFILNLPKKAETLTSFFNWIVPEKFQPLVYPLINLLQRISDVMLQHLSGAFTRALNEDKIFYFEKMAQFLIASLNNGTLPRKCIDMQKAFCNFDEFQAIFVRQVDEETGETSSLVDENIGTLQGIQELGCLFFGKNYSSQDVEESTPILAKLYYTLSTLNDTQQLSSSLASLTSSNSTMNSNTTTKMAEDQSFLTSYTSRILEVYLLATKSVSPNTWSRVFDSMSYTWKSNRLFDRFILGSRVLQLSANCFVPKRIVDSPLWRIIQRKNIIANEMLNLVLDEINQAIEKEKFSLEQLSAGSTTLNDFLRKNLDILPVLVDATFETLFTDLPQFIEKVFLSNGIFLSGWPCNKFSLTNVLAIKQQKHRSQIQSIEDFICRQTQMHPGSYGRILDELLTLNNNQSRVAPLIRVMYSKSNNLSFIYEHVALLDWVEAATSISLVKDSVEKLILADSSIVWLPEIENFDQTIRESFFQMALKFKSFHQQGNIGLMAYLGDIFTPIAIRYISFSQTFSETCDYGVSGVLMAPIYNDREWQCFFASLKFASYSVQSLFDLLNDVLRNFLHLKNSNSTISSKVACNLIDFTGNNDSNNKTILYLIDHLPEMVEMILDKVLFGDFNRLSKTESLHDLFCYKSTANLDLFQSRPLLQDVRHALCKLSVDINSCSQLVLSHRWSQALDRLNQTWYSESLDEMSKKGTFVEATQSIYRFIDLFGQFSPRFFNSLVAKFKSAAHGQVFVTKSLERLNEMDRFSGKRFAYVFQSITQELHGVLFNQNKNLRTRQDEERRDLLIALVYAFNELPDRLRQRYKLGAIKLKPPSKDDDLLQIDLLDSLLDWFDSHFLVTFEFFLETLMFDNSRLLKLFENKYDTVTIWRALCRAPISQHFVVDNRISIDASRAKNEICKIDFNSVYSQWHRNLETHLSNYTEQELLNLFLVKIGSAVDLISNDAIYRRDLLKFNQWKSILAKMNRPNSSNLTFENDELIRIVANFSQNAFQKSWINVMHRLVQRLQCGLKIIPMDGLNWKNAPKIYQDRPQVMSFLLTVNSAFTILSVGMKTVITQDKFYRNIQLMTKYGVQQGFCQLSKTEEFDKVFALDPISKSEEILAVLKNFQTFLCQNMKDFLFDLNPVSKCLNNQLQLTKTNLFDDLKALTSQNIFKEFKQDPFDLIKTTPAMDHLKNVPQILDQKQWNLFFKWWENEIDSYPNIGRVLFVMRFFQLIDVFADNHVIWKAFYRLTFLSSELFAYSLRALQINDGMYPIGSDMKLPMNKHPFNQLLRHVNRKGLSYLLTTAVSNVIFPEVDHFITFATFRQLRWIRHISHFFAQHPNILHDEMCPTLNTFNQAKQNNGSAPMNVDEDFNDLLLLLCHNHPSDWIYSLTFKSNLFNIKAAPRPKFISHRKIRERIGKLAQVLARMLDYNSHKNNQKLDNVVQFLKQQQLKSIENVVGTSGVLLKATMASPMMARYNNSSFKELLKIGWRSVPALLDTVDQYICSYKRTGMKNLTEFEEMEFVYHPRAPDMKLIMCDMPNWDFDQTYSYLSKHLDLKNLFLSFAPFNPSKNISETSSASNYQCFTPLRFLSRWVDVGQEMFSQMSSLSFWSESKSCKRRQLISLLASTKSSNLFLLRHSLRYVRFINKLLSTIDKFSRENNGVSWHNVKQLWQTSSFFVLNQVPAYVPIIDILQSDVNLPEYLNATMDRISTLSRSKAKQAIRLLTDSMLDINAISWHNFSNIALKEMICKHSDWKFYDSNNHYLPIVFRKNDSLSFPPNLTNLNNDTTLQKSLYDVLCNTQHSSLIIDSLVSAIDQKSIHKRLNELQRTELTNNNWVSEVLIPEMSSIVSSGTFTDLQNKIDIIQGFDKSSTSKEQSFSQKGINHLLISFVSLTRAKNFNTLYDSIKQAIGKLTPKFSQGPIVDSLNQILKGLKSLKDLSNRGLFQIKYLISDLLVNVDNVKIFLEKNLILNRATVNQILNATIDLGEFIEMSARVSFDSSAFCNKTLLFNDLKLHIPILNETELPSEEMVANAFCMLSITEDFKFNNQILNQLVIRKLTHNLVNLILNGLLKKANIDTNQIPQAVNAIRTSSLAMPHVKSFIRNISAPLNMLEIPIQNLSLSYASNMIGHVVCGGPMPALNREIKILKLKVQNPKVSKQDQNSFASDFCLNGYKQIINIPGGIVIWNFLKPILVGKILYAPKAPVTNNIMAHMNTTLKFMPKIIEMLHAWSQTLSSLETFYVQSDVNNRMSHVKHLIESIFINGEANGLFDDIDTFNLIEKMTKSGNLLAVVKLIGQIAQCVSFDRFVGLQDEIELEELARNLTKEHKFIAGIVFDGNHNDYLNIKTVPMDIAYKIRIDIDFVPSTKSLKARIWEPGPRDHYLDDMGYLHGFVQIQELIDRAIMSFLTNRTVLPIEPEVYLQQQPYLCHEIDKYGNYIRSLSPLITTMAWIFLIAYLIREHVLERELHLEEVMRVMGLKSGVAWLTWFIIGFFTMTFATVSGICLLYAGQLIPASDPLLLFLFFMIFNISLLMFCYMMSAFFKTATIAALSGIVAYLASFLPFMVAITLENEMNYFQKIITCLSMSTSFCFGMMYMTRFEVQGVGMQWTNLWHSPMQGDTMNVGIAMIMMGVDSIIYFLIAWYISHVSPPGKNARSYSWFFFLTLSYWKTDFFRSFGFGENEVDFLSDKNKSLHSVETNDGSKIAEDKTEDNDGDFQIDNTSIILENDGTFNIVDPDEWKSLNEKRFFQFVNDDNTMIADGTLKTISGTLRKTFQNASLKRKSSQTSNSTVSQVSLGMEIRGLYVVYNEKSNKSKHIAVSNLNINLKEGQITTILGRNGAGKTTTINVLTGQLPPTSGSVSIYGYRIPEEFSSARRLLGYCPQYDTLFNNLTVREHLMFFAELKGLLQSSAEIEKDVDEILLNMGLLEMQHQLAKHLSGGLKRRLCVALAFVGGSKLIILDEPTASVDPVARRQIWDLILQQKRSRTVLLTTHHMDEAEILSDEVAVIYRGKLLCIGSPLLLKSKYGCGYRLNVSKQGSFEEDSFLDDYGQNDENELNSRNTEMTIDRQPMADVERLIAFTKCLIPNSSFVEDNANGEVIFSLPHHDDHGVPHDYATFFRCLDSNVRTLGFGSYGVTSTTLEEVFLTLCNLEECNMPVDEAKLVVAKRFSFSADHSSSAASTPRMVHSNDPAIQFQENLSEEQINSGIRLKFLQFYSLLSKRFLHMFRDWKLLFCTFFLPCLFIAFAMAMALIKPSFAPDPSLPLVPHIYGESTVSFLHNEFAVRQNYSEEFQSIENELVLHESRLVNCLQPKNNWRTSKCPILHENLLKPTLPQHLFTLKGKAWELNSRTSCRCQECFKDISQMSQLILQPINSSYGWIYNLSRGVDINEFLLRTQPEFMDRRWGGWSFNLARSHIAAKPKKRHVAKIWYDNNGYHSMPSYLNSLNNAILRANLKKLGIGRENSSRYQIITYSHPLHVRSNQIGDQSLMQQAGDSGIAIIILVGFIFIPTSYVFYIVRERICEEKHLQRTFGVGPLLYWLSSLFWDVSVLILAIGFASAIILFFRLPIYMARLNLPAVLTLLFFFGWAMINLVYLMEKLFSEPSLAFMGIYCLALFVGIYTMVMRLMIDVFKLIEITPAIYQMFERIAVFFPPYLLLSGIVDIHRNQLFADVFTLFDQDAYVNPFKYELLGRYFSTFVLQGIVFFIINIAIEYDFLSMIYFAFFKPNYMLKIKQSDGSSDKQSKDEDSDVAEERRRVHMLYSSENMTNSQQSNSCTKSLSNSSDSNLNGSASSFNSPLDILRVFNVTKIFENMFGYRCAVNNINFTVPQGECFGLLGVNGAGKTTLFRILTGQVKATTGEASFYGRDIRKELASNRGNRSIGYCPQADALDNFLTPIEHLTIYARLRGIPNNQISMFVNDSIERFQLKLHAFMPVQALSRGNRRKLCLAIAMLGNPRLILLDEPTSGLDPQSRRHVCKNIQDAIRDRRSILLTSHSMEECDILCSRLAIMVNGNFKCIGSPQYLKHKFGTGYIITLRLSENKNNFKMAVKFIKDQFQQAVLRAHHHTMLEFNLPTSEISLSTIFQVLQQAHVVLSLQDYSVSQTTLDQVFVSFANQQVNDYESDDKSNYNEKVSTNDNNNIVQNILKNEPNSISNCLSVQKTRNNIKRQASRLMFWCSSTKKCQKTQKNSKLSKSKNKKVLKKNTKDRESKKNRVPNYYRKQHGRNMKDRNLVYAQTINSPSSLSKINKTRSLNHSLHNLYNVPMNDSLSTMSRIPPAPPERIHHPIIRMMRKPHQKKDSHHPVAFNSLPPFHSSHRHGMNEFKNLDKSHAFKEPNHKRPNQKPLKKPVATNQSSRHPRQSVYPQFKNHHYHPSNIHSNHRFLSPPHPHLRPVFMKMKTTAVNAPQTPNVVVSATKSHQQHGVRRFG